MLSSRQVPYLAVGALLAVSLALDGCAMNARATSAAASNAPRSPDGKEDCLWFRTLDDWSPVDRDRLIVYGPGRVPYLATLAFPSFDLNWNLAVGFQDRDNDGRLCGGFDAILLREGVPDRINIASLKRIDKADAKALLEAVDPRHRKAKKVDKALEAKDDEGRSGG